MNQKIEVSRQTKEVIEHLIWVICNELPEDISTSSSNDKFTIFNLKSDKRLELKIKDEK